MNRKIATGIALGAAALVAAAAVLSNMRAPSPERERGSPMVAGLESRAGDVAAVEVLRANSTVRLEREPSGQWVVASSDRFPARTELVRALLVSVAGLTVEDRMTAKKDRHGELGLAWPDPSGKARTVRFLRGDPTAEPVAEVVLGEERFAPDGVFARLPSQDQTWRTAGRVQLPVDAMGWVERTLLSLPPGETVSASFDGLTATAPAEGAEPPAGAPRAPWDTAVAEQERARWSDAQVDSARTGLPSFLDRLELEGVRRAHDDRPEPAFSPSFRMRSGATVHLEGHKETDGTWFRLVIVPPADPKPAEPPKHEGDPFVPDWKALADRVAGWQFRMPEWKAETLTRMRAAPAPARGADGTLPAVAPPTIAR